MLESSLRKLIMKTHSKKLNYSNTVLFTKKQIIPSLSWQGDFSANLNSPCLLNQSVKQFDIMSNTVDVISRSHIQYYYFSTKRFNFLSISTPILILLIWSSCAVPLSRCWMNRSSTPSSIRPSHFFPDIRSADVIN